MAQAQLRSQEQQVPASPTLALPPMFDQCTHAILTALSFVTSSAVMVASSEAAVAARAASAPQRRVFDEFDLDSPSPPRPAHASSRNAQQSRQDHEPFQLDAISPSSLVLHRSQQVPPPARVACLTYSPHAARRSSLHVLCQADMFRSVQRPPRRPCCFIRCPLCPAQLAFTF
jgi:hypothetical protein